MKYAWFCHIWYSLIWVIKVALSSYNIVRLFLIKDNPQFSQICTLKYRSQPNAFTTCFINCDKLQMIWGTKLTYQSQPNTIFVIHRCVDYKDNIRLHIQLAVDWSVWVNNPMSVLQRYIIHLFDHIPMSSSWCRTLSC